MFINLLEIDAELIAIDKTTTHHVIRIDGTTLMVFVAQAHCWQFRLISAGGEVFRERKIYYTPEAALKAGLEWIGQGRHNIQYLVNP